MRFFSVMMFAFIFTRLLESSAHAFELAYLGPGAGLSALGSLLALIAAVFVAIFGFVWYPVKRLLKKKKKAGATSEQSEEVSEATDE